MVVASVVDAAAVVDDADVVLTASDRAEAAVVDAVVVSPISVASDAVLVVAAADVEVEIEVDWLADVEDTSVVATRKEAEAEVVARAVATEEGPGTTEGKNVIDIVAEAMVPLVTTTVER